LLGHDILSQASVRLTIMRRSNRIFFPFMLDFAMMLEDFLG